MSRSSKYDTFCVSDPYELPYKRSCGIAVVRRDVALTRDYVIITCPHCNLQFGETTLETIAKMKSTHCAKHLIECRSFEPSTSIIVAPKKKKDELAELKAEMAEMKRKDVEKDRRLENLESKTSLYDSVLEAVMPSLALPLTAPVQNAKITLRDAAIKDLAHQTLALPAPIDVVSREMHIAMIEQKDAMIASEKAHREEFNGFYKKQLDEKNSELEKAIFEKQVAEKQTKELLQAADESAKTAASASSRADRLQRERDAYKVKFDASLKGHEQSVRNHGKHGQSMLAKLLYTEKRGYTAITDQEADASRAIEREYARKEALKRARHA